MFRPPHVRVYAVLTALVVLLLGSCGRPLTITIVSPVHGSIIDASTLLVSGVTSKYDPAYVVRVNGVVTTLQPNKTWSVTIPLNTVATANPVEAEVVTPGGVRRHRITVIAGPSVADGALSQQGVALRFNNTGLAAVAPLVESLAGSALDISDLILGQGPLIEGQQFFTFTVSADAYEASIGGFGLDVAAQAAGHTDAEITVENLHLGIVMNITDDLAIDMNCTLEIDVDAAVISGSYDMLPAAGDPVHVDVNQLGEAAVALNGVSYQFISGACDPDAPVVGGLINAILAAGANIETLMADGFRDNLADPDGAGPLDSPIADGIEEALAGISIAGEVSAAVGVNLDAPFHQIAEDADGILLGAHAGFTTVVGPGPAECQPPPGAPDFAASLDVPVAGLGFGATTPGGAPYGLGLAISASAFNQLLRSTVECGMLNLQISEIVFGGVPQAVNSNVLALLGMPEFLTAFGANYPLEMHIAPTLPPLVTANAGPSGEMAELVIPHLSMKIVDPADGMVWLTMIVDTRFGLDLVFDPETSTLAPTITAPLPGVTKIRVESNPISVNPAVVEAALPAVFASFFTFFSDLFGAFPLPSFFGLGLEVVEIDRTGGYFRLFTNLVETPTTRIANPVFTDLAPADFVTDDVFDVREWRHRAAMTNTTATSLGFGYQGVLAADACCTLGDEEASVTAAYRLEFDVIPENGESWRLDFGHSFLGALTLVDEANALYDGSELAQFTTPVRGRVSIGGGPYQSFDFPVGPVTSVFDGFGGAEDDHSVEVSGANGLQACGSSPVHVVLEFDWTTRVVSDSNAVFPAINGGEAAVRFGVHDTITLGTDPEPGFTAGDYPGLGNRNIADDGHFASVGLTALPGGCP